MKLAEGETDMGNKVTNQMVKKEPDHPPTQPELACSILERTDKWAIRHWKNIKHQQDCLLILGQKYAKHFLQQPSAKRSINY
jgi:hypothetical protein